MKELHRNNFLIIFGLICILTTSLVCTNLDSFAAEELFTIKIAHESPEDHPYHLWSVKFKEIIEEMTNGKVEVIIYPGAILGGAMETLEQVEVGAIQITLSASLIAQLEPKFGVFELPFLFENREHARRVMESQLVDEANKSLIANKGVRVLAPAELGFRQITNSVRPISKIEDIVGLKIRTPENRLRIKTFNALGATATPIPAPEMYTALEQRVVDGQENPVNSILSNHMYEVNKYLTISNHIYSPTYAIVNEKWLQYLPDDIKDAVFEAGKQASEFQVTLSAASEKDILRELENKGMEVSYLEDYNTAKEIIKNTIWAEQSEEILEMIEKILNL